MITIADAIDQDVLRIRHEFLETARLVLTAVDVARLCGLSAAHATRLLETLEAEGFLVSDRDGAYRRSPSPRRDSRS